MNNKGFTLAGVMVAAGIVGMIAVAVMQISKNAGFVQNSSQAGLDELEALTSMRMILDNPSYCRVSLAGNDPITTPVKFRKVDIDNPATEGLDVELWISDVAGNARTAKRFSVTDSAANKFGKILLTKIKLVMDNPTVPVGNNYPLGTNSDFGKLMVTMEKNISGQKRSVSQSFDLYLTFDTDATGESSILSCTRYTATSSASESEFTLYFGGMFGYNAGAGYNNPLTGAKSCPIGYTSVPLIGKSGLDYEAHLCYRHANDKTLPLPVNYYAFGGMHGESGSGGYPNPITGAKSCPAGYSTGTSLGQTGLDYVVNYCYKNLGSTLPDSSNSKDFGGAHGDGNGDTSYPNPATGVSNCPVGFNKTRILGTSSVDYGIYVCTRP